MTLVGVLVVGAAVAGYLYIGRKTHDFIATYASLTVLAIAAIDVLGIGIGGIVTWFSVKRALKQEVNLKGITGQRMKTGVNFAALWWLPFGDIKLGWKQDMHVITVKSRGFGRRAEVIIPKQRGRFKQVERRFRVFDILGLAGIEFTVTRDVNIEIRPRPIPMDIRTSLWNKSGDGYSHPMGEPSGDWVEIRPYVWGDPLRLVVWKVYARTHKLLVRTQERAITTERSVGVYFIPGESDEAGASVVRALVERVLVRGTYFFMTDGGNSPVKEKEEVLDLLVQSVKYRSKGGNGLFNFFTILKQRGLHGCIIVVPQISGKWVDKLNTAVTRSGIRPVVLVGFDPDTDKNREQAVKQVVQRSFNIAKDVMVVDYPYGDIGPGSSFLREQR